MREPNLYRVQSVSEAGEDVSGIHRRRRLGFGRCEWDAKRGFFLNGKQLKIKGTCNHQQHAGVGIAMPDRVHELRVEKLEGDGVERVSVFALHGDAGAAGCVRSSGAVGDGGKSAGGSRRGGAGGI